VYVTGDVSPEQIQQLNEGRAQQAQEGEEDTSRLALPNASEH
jgi:amidophosphoribosyltransferase